ncbi:MAG: translocation/assembly module TamB domain-containing protein [Salinibacter sp.]
MGSPSPSDPESSPSSAPSGASRLRQWGRRGLWILGGVGGIPLLLGGLLLLAVQTEMGATAAVQFLAPRVNPMPNTTLSVEQASGNWVRSLRLTNVSLTRPDSAGDDAVTMAHVDTLAVRYRLWALLEGRLHFPAVSVSGPSVTLRQAPDSTWDWLRRTPGDEASAADTSAGMPIRVDRLRVTNGQFRASFYAGGRDSTAHVRDVSLRAHDLQLGPSYGGTLDTLGLQGQLPGDTTALSLAARGALSSHRLQLDTLALTSPRSQVHGHGTARLPLGPDDALSDVALSLRADPLVLGDLTAVLPSLDVNPRETLDLNAHLTGSQDRLLLTVEAHVRNGGTLTAEIEATPRTDAPPGSDLFYRIDAQARCLTTSLLGPSDPTQNSITATIDGRLQGPTPDSLTGTLSAELTNSRLYGVETDSLALQSTVRTGAASIDLQGSLNGVSLSVNGSAHPFDAAPTADLTAHIQDLSLATLAPDVGIAGTLSATTSLQARAIGQAGATYDVDARLSSAQIGRQRIEAGHLSATLRPDTATAAGTLRFPRGRVRVAGGATLDGAERFILETGRFENVNVAAIMGDTTDSQLTGSVQAQGRGFSPSTMQGQATLAIQDAHYGPHRLTSLTTDVRLDAGRLAAETKADLNGSDWHLAVSGRPFADVPTIEITDGRFRNLNIGPFLQDTTQSSTLNGTLQARLQGVAPDTLRLDGRLTLEPSRINRQPISGGSLDVALREETLTSTLVLNTPNGTARVTGRARPFDAVPQYRISEGTFDNLDVGALIGVPGLSTALSGDLTLAAQGTSLATLRLDSKLTVQASTVNRAALSDGRLTLHAEGGRLETTGRFAVAGGRLRVQGRLDSLGHAPRYHLRTTARSLDVSALAGLDSLRATLRSARWTVEGRGTALNDLTATTRLSADSVRIGDIRLHTLALAGTFEDGLFRTDTLSARSNVGTLHGKGPLGLTATAGPSKFNVRATVTNLQPLHHFVGPSSLQVQKGVIDAHIYGAAGSQRFDGTLELNGFIYNDVRLSAVSGSFNGARGETQLLDHLEFDAEAGYVSALGLTATQARLQSQYDGTTLELATDVKLDAKHRLSLNTSFRPTADPLAIHLHQLNARMGPDRWSLRRETTLTIGAAYRIDEFLLESGVQRIKADGVVNPRGRQDLRVVADSVRLGGIAPLLGLSGLGGTASGTLRLSGPATAPSFDGRLDLTLRSKKENVGTLQLDVGYDDLSVALDARLTHRDGSVLTLNGTVPADLRLQAPTPVSIADRSVRLEASTERFPINWIDPFLDPATVRSVTGTLTADATVRGTLTEPDLSGTLSVANLGASLPTLKTHYRDGTARVQLADDQLTLNESQIRSSNGGSLSVTGVVNFPELTLGEYDLSIEASNFLAINTPAYRRTVIDGNMTLQGTVQHPVLNGSVQVLSGSVYYTEALAESAGSLSTVSLSAQDQLTLEERFGIRLTAADTTTFDMYEALSMDLTVEIGGDTWLRSTGTPELNVQLTGDLDVQKGPGETDPRIFGTINVRGERSTLRQFGQEFQITEGSLTFNGDPYSPYLNLTAVYDQRAPGAQGSEVRITLSLTGRPENLTPTLSSEPPMSNRNILSYLATGRPANALFSGTSEGGSLATQVALGQATNFVENLAASELRLDVVRLQVRPEGTSYLTVGRYLTPRFFASIEQPVLTTSSDPSLQSTVFIPDVTLEYRFTDYLLLRSRSNQQSLQFNLLFEYAY